MPDIHGPGPHDDASWYPQIPPKSAPVTLNRKKSKLRPVDHLARQLEEAPVAAEPDMAPPPPPSETPGPERPQGLPPAPPRPHGEIWKGCPIKPLGVNGGFCYYLDGLGQMRAIAKHDRMALMQLFNRLIPQLCHHFPKWVKDTDTGEYRRKSGEFAGDPAAMAMMQACGEKGLFDPEGAVRGVGAWVDDDGRLIYHAGDRLILSDGEMQPGTHQGRIYPAYPSIPAPAATATGAPARDFLDAVETWNFARPDIDPMVILGMTGIQMLGGAMDWRAAFWLTGPPGAGKSFFQKLLGLMHGGEKGLIQSPDATARGIASLLGHSTLPVALDELEPGDADSAKERAIIETARVAASGGKWMRGSSDQKGSSGQLRSTFMFSSVLIPGVLKSQDLQRIITLHLQPLAEGATPPNMRADTWRKRGAMMKRQLIDRWPTWGQRQELWREAFAEHKITGRNADNWATTLAMADMALHAELPTVEVTRGWAAKIAKHIRADLAELGNDADELLAHLLTQPFEPIRRSEIYLINDWVRVAAECYGTPNVLGRADRPTTGLTDSELAHEAKAANARLASIGLRVLGQREGAILFIANKPIEGLKRLFAHTPWAGGAWKQSAQRVPGAACPATPRHLAGVSTRGVEIPFTSMPALLALPADRDRLPQTPPEGEAPLWKPEDDFA